MKWTIKTLLLRASEILKERGVTQTPRLDAELLLSYSLGFSDRVKLYTEFDRPLTEDEVEKYRKLIVRRVKGEPVAYITGKKEFYGYTFRVERGVLIPRPETELLVDVVLEYLKGKEGKTIVDVGTGSGCIIITLCKLLGKIHRYVGTDISSIALKVAEKNRRIHGCREVEFVKTDLLKGVKPPISVVVSNPPYVPVGDARLEESVKKFEPAVALFGGKDGLEVIRRLIPQSYEKLEVDGLIALEVGEGQAEAVKELLEIHGFKDVKLHKDIAGIERVVSAIK